MNITLSPQTEKRITEKVRQGGFDSPESVIEQAVTFFLDYEDDEMTDSEFLDVKAAIEEGLEQADRGEGISLEDFDRRMRAKYWHTALG
ncbi:MAG: hypothetical protein U0Q16_27720 [Bryobacteraceae bacterium]